MASPDAGVAAGKALLDVGRVDEARRQAATVLAEWPDNADAMCLLARCHEESGDYEAMLAVAGEAAAVAPDRALPHLLRGVALLRLDRGDEAAGAAADALRVAPENWFAHLLYGMALVDLPGHGRAGRAAIRRAVALAPDQPYAHLVQGLVHRSRSRYFAARRAFRRALALNPGYADALESLGQMALHDGFLASAARHLGAAANVAPTTPDAATNLERVVHSALGWAFLTVWSAGVFLMFAMYPVAWAIAAAIVLAGGWWLRRVWRALPPGGRVLARHRVATDARSYLRLAFTGVAAVVALAVGVASSIAGTAASARLALATGGSLLGVLFIGGAAVLVADARLDPARSARAHQPPRDLPFDELNQRMSALLAWRWFRAAGPAVLAVAVLAAGDLSWPARASAGTAVLGLYWLAARSILRRLRARQGPPPPLVLGRLGSALWLAWVVLIAYLGAAVYLPAPPGTLSAYAVMLVSATAVGHLIWLSVRLIRTER